MSIEIADVLRKLVLGQVAVISVMIVWTIVRYAKKIKSAPANDKALPTHVSLVASSYMVFLVIVCLVIHDNFGHVMKIYLPLALVGCALGCGAMAFMLSHLGMRRALLAALDRAAQKAASDAAARSVDVQERRMNRMEEVGRETHDAVQEIQQDAVVAKETAKEVSDKADVIGDVGTDTNVRVRKMEQGNGGGK